jgi:hypothetical protein
MGIMKKGNSIRNLEYLTTSADREGDEKSDEPKTAPHLRGAVSKVW